MNTQLQLRRGTTAEHAAFTGAVGEITVDTTKDTVVVHDGTTAGGHPLSKAPDEQVLTDYTIAGTAALPASTDTVNQAIGKLSKQLTPTGILKSNGTVLSAASDGTDYLSSTTGVLKSTFDANTILAATTDNTPVALTVTEQTVVGRATGGNISVLSIDSDLSSVSENNDTIPSSKAVVGQIGTLSNLTTTEKTNLVGSINEINSTKAANAFSDPSGNIAALTVPGALEELGEDVAENSADISDNAKNTADVNGLAAFATILSRCKYALSAKGILGPYSVASGLVSKWHDNGYNALAGNSAAQGTSGLKPAYVQNIPFCSSITVLPDVAGGVAGKGFTCTGLAYDAAEDIFYAGNIGKALPATPGFASTIVKLSSDFMTNTGEIDLHTVYPSMSDIQGLTIDTSDDTIWFCSYAENKIRHVSKAGVDIGYLAYTNPTGIAYDVRTNSLWVLNTASSLVNIGKTGTVIKTIAVAYTGQDQLFLDIPGNKIYFTAGANYQGTNYVYVVDLSTDAVSLAYNLIESYAVEGIYINKNVMHILNDGYYHSGTVAVNQVNTYDLSRLTNAMQFDATDDVLTVPANADIGHHAQMTIIAVYHLHGAGGGNSGRIYDKTSGGNAGHCVNVGVGTRIQYVNYQTDGMSAWTTCDNLTIPKGVTHMATVTHDTSDPANEPLIYIDGVLQGYYNTATASAGFTDDSAIDLCVGNWADGTRALNGVVFELYVIDKILSQDVVTNIYNTLSQYYAIGV